MNHYFEMRQAMAQRLPDGLILLTGGRPVERNHDVEYVFRQDSNFLYLTGVEEPGCHLLIDPKRRRHTLFIPKVDSHHRVWLGHVPDTKEAGALFGFARVRYADALGKELREARRGYKKCYADKAAFKAFGKELGLPNGEAALRDALDELRICKTPGELALLRQASVVTSQAHRKVMASVRPGQFEYQVQAVFESECVGAGLKHLAYPSIVAAGANAAVLHYSRNNARLKDGDLLLIDAGAELKGYASDITRTFPVNGRFSARQKDVYAVVLETQKKCIERARPGIVSSDLHIEAMTSLAEGLKSLGLLKGDTTGLVEGGAVRLFFPHGLTHTLGLDVHDTFGGRKRRMPNPAKVPVRFVARLEPGFVITMEPGLYFIAALLHDPALRRKHRGSVDFAKAETFLDFGGIRIEDDVVVREDGPPENLTSVAKEIADVEAACAR